MDFLINLYNTLSIHNTSFGKSSFFQSPAIAPRRQIQVWQIHLTLPWELKWHWWKKYIGPGPRFGKVPSMTSDKWDPRFFSYKYAAACCFFFMFCLCFFQKTLSDKRVDIPHKIWRSIDPQKNVRWFARVPQATGMFMNMFLWIFISKCFCKSGVENILNTRGGWMVHLTVRHLWGNIMKHLYK